MMKSLKGGAMGLQNAVRSSVFAGLTGAIVLTAACATVKVQAPDEPIEINLNVKIDQEVRFKMDDEIEDLIANNPDIF